jgi:F-type H+-transporting ATPase subunit b
MANETAHTEVPGGQPPTFPPFDRQTFPSQLLWLTVTFVTLYLLMAKIALPRIGGIVEQRTQRIGADIAEARRLKEESDAAIAAYEKALAEARTRAQAMVGEARQKQAADAETARKALDTQLNARVAEAERATADTKANAMVNVRGIATEAAAAIVERLVGIAPPSRDLVAQAVAEALKR